MKKLTGFLILFIIYNLTLYANKKINTYTINSDATNHTPLGSSFTPSTKGYFGTVETGFVNGFTKNGFNFVKLNVIKGYQFNSYFLLGIGVGIKRDISNSAYMLPLFMRIQTKILNKPVSPQFSTDFGYSHDITHDGDRYGFFGRVILGVSFDIFNQSSLNIGLGYEAQKTVLWKDYYSPILTIGPYSWYEKELSTGFSINIGFTF
ncbi:MAG: hypothetical protein K8S16_13205 [Bacteroidales bacterium]|nr:hypothetical protein [Bacteroidales bacterium]